MKKSLLAIMLGVAALGNLEAATYDFSYVNGIQDYLGLRAAETYDVAIFLPGDLFEGFSIKGISAKVNSNGGVSSYADPSLWLSGSLDLTGNSFTPGIASYPSEIQTDGTLSAELPEGYSITSSGVYVGYTLTVSKLTSGTQYPMGFDDSSDTNSFFCRTNKTMPQWSNIAAEMKYGAAITVVLESDNVPAQSVMISSIKDPLYLEIGKPSTVNIGLTSFGGEPVTSVDVEYSIDGHDGTTHFDLPETVPAGLNKKFDVNLDLPAFDNKFAGEYSFAVTKVNGQPNESAKGQKFINVASFAEFPVHQTLIEEYTGTWCQFCTRGYAALEYMRENEPDFVIAAFHNNDPMAITSSYPSVVSGYPCVYLDRYYSGDPYWGTTVQYSEKLLIVDEIKALNAEITPWGIEVSHKWEDDNHLVATADVWNILGYEDEKYEIAYLLVSDGLQGTASSWYQTNAYASSNPSSEAIEELNAFCKGGKYGTSKVGGLVFNDVVVSTTGIYGIAGSVPSTLEAEQKASHSLTFDLTKISSRLIPDKNKLRVIAAVLDKRGIVLNCAKNEVNDFVSGVGTLEASSDAPVEYYNLNGVKVSEPSNGIFIRKQGSKTSKVVIR